ncbi:hypothetical protein VTN49DRAFT_6254 [Thermomyces lanuginosus]|uniref:uncharacterized protein n=1 Tax=Thermomyces lanuginosus TaxID=5541 RepID=UPI00374343FC
MRKGRKPGSSFFLNFASRFNTTFSFSSRLQYSFLLAVLPLDQARGLCSWSGGLGVQVLEGIINQVEGI